MRSVIAHAVAMTLVVAAAMLIMAACQRKPVMAHAQFKHLPGTGWLQSQPLSFMPEYDDSTATYDLAVAVRHDNSYRYRNLSLVVEIIAADTTINCKSVNMMLADEYGNWSGGGFGALYQNKVNIADNVLPSRAHKVVIRQAMAEKDTLCGVVDVGIIATPR